MTWEQGTVEISCPQCGAVYECTYENLPARVWGEQLCEDCGGVVRAWTGARDYDHWKLIKHGSHKRRA